MNLIDPTSDNLKTYNELQLKHLKARTQLMEAAALLAMFLLFVLIALTIAAAGLVLVWLIGWLFR